MNLLENVLSTKPFEFVAGEPYPDVDELRAHVSPVEDDIAIRMHVQEYKDRWNSHLIGLDGIKKILHRSKEGEA